MGQAPRVVCVREYAWLSTEPVSDGLDAAWISESAFDHVCRLGETVHRQGVKLIQVQGRKRLKLDSHVGVIETPCGTQIEILPKHTESVQDVAASRVMLRRLLSNHLNLRSREVGWASLQTFDAPLTDWVMRHFLDHLDHLLARGVRYDYRPIEEELGVIRGRLNMAAQMRQAPGRGHRFQVRHDVYDADRAENRLLRLALETIGRHARDPELWRRAREIAVRWQDIPVSRQIDADFHAWRDDRLMAHYQAIKPWCEIILQRQMPLALAGDRRGISMLYPMEKLFEAHVARCLRRALLPGVELKTPARSHSLARHLGEPMFQLEPDIWVAHADQAWVLDTKWKLLRAYDRDNKYDLSQGDFYQLFAYGQKYLQGQGHMALIYPRSAAFEQPLAPFELDTHLTLHVLPFDLDCDRLLGVEALGLPLNKGDSFVDRSVTTLDSNQPAFV